MPKFQRVLREHELCGTLSAVVGCCIIWVLTERDEETRSLLLSMGFSIVIDGRMLLTLHLFGAVDARRSCISQYLPQALAGDLKR
jgi:hypothetical protein